MNLISVIVPVYNMVEYLPRCIDSILFQSYNNIELILIDDGSNDGSEFVCDSYARNDLRVKVIHKLNGGVSSARNAGLRLAQGDFITFVDGDDYLDADMYSHLIKISIENNADIAVCGFFQESDKGELKPYFKGSEQVVLDRYNMILSALQNKYFSCSMCDKLFRRNIIAGICLQEDIMHNEDFLFIYQAMKKAETLVFSPRPLYYYCNNDKSASRIAFGDKNMSIINAQNIVLNDIQMCFPDLYSKARIEYVRVNIMCADLAAKAGYRNKAAIKTLCKNIKEHLSIFLKGYSANGLKICALLLSIHYYLFCFVIRLKQNNQFR